VCRLQDLITVSVYSVTVRDSLTWMGRHGTTGEKQAINVKPEILYGRLPSVFLLTLQFLQYGW
jgi:hypothetical protein